MARARRTFGASPSRLRRKRTSSLLRAAAVALVATVALAAPAAGPSAVGAFLLGDQQVETIRDQNSPGIAEAFRATAASSGTVVSLSVYVDASSTATKLTAGLYADAGGKPGTLLAQGAISPVPAGAWNQIAVAGAAVTAGATYWIAILSPTGSGTIKFRDKGCCVRSETSASRTLSELPQSWSTGSVFDDSPLSAYGSAAVSTQPILSVSPSSLSFSATEGGPDPAPASLSVTNTGGGTLSFTASAAPSWLTVTPASGSAPQTLQVSAASTGLTAGSYTGQVSLTATGAQGSPAVVPVTLTVSAPPQPSVGVWPTVDHDPGRSGYAAGESAITTTTAQQLALKWSAKLDGKVTAQPLVAAGVQIGGQSREVVVAATSANSLYALDAATGATLWRRNFGAQPGNCAVPGGFGITGAPVIDAAAGRIYAVSDDGQLRVVSLASGADAATPLPVIDLPATNKVWGGLDLVGGRLYVATASDGCDTPPWRGRIYEIDVSGAAPRLLATFVVVPGIAAPNGGGGIWGYGGVSIDTASGRVFAATGADSNELYEPYADRVIALDSTLNVLGSYEPFHPSSIPCNGTPCDVDFGATPIVFQPSACPTLVAVGNKDGNLYLHRADDLAASGQPLQVLRLNTANDWLGNGGIGGVPAYWPEGRMLFVTDAGSGVPGIAAGIVGLTVRADCTLEATWSAAIGGNQQPNSTPTVANGVVFVGDGNGGAVRAYNAATGALLWNGGALGGSTYAAPAVANGTLYTASWDGSGSADAGTVRAFAPSAPPPPPPPPPPGVLLGNQAIESQLDQNAMGQAEAFEVTANAAGVVGSLSIYLDASSTATKLVAGLYADGGGHPGTLISQGSSTQLAAGAWNTIAIPAAPVTAGSTYWIAILGTQSGTPRFRDRATGCRSETSSQQTLTALPAAWTSGTVYDDCPLSGYGSSA